jgi:hypothetical protein
VTTGAWSATQEANDWLVWGFSSDTDNAGAVSAFSITTSGITYSTTNHRNRNLNGFANDCGVYSFDNLNTFGSSSSATTVAFTRVGSDCGPAIVVRIREQSPGVLPAPLNMGRWT